MNLRIGLFEKQAIQNCRNCSEPEKYEERKYKYIAFEMERIGSGITDVKGIKIILKELFAKLNNTFQHLDEMNNFLK